MRNTTALLAKAKKCKVRQLDPTAFEVCSPSGSKYTVTVQPTGRTIHDACTCPWGERNTTLCAHALAVELHLAKREGVTIAVWPTKTDALRQHRHIVPAGDMYITVRR